LGRPIVTNGDFVAHLCESDALFSNYFEDLLLVRQKVPASNELNICRDFCFQAVLCAYVCVS